jgi:GH25 family lysozyme M1 (1,4-beta-N-acetylmuramidase)
MGSNKRIRALPLLALVVLTVISGSAFNLPATDGASRRHPKKAEGIDVSHWQGTINWTKVAAAGKKFAFVKATQNTTFLDPLYATNRTGARSAGVFVGAYHYAKPSSTAGDAVAEARWFVSNTVWAANDLRPALDLETAGGLGVSALRQWVRAWLGEVYRLTGRPAIIYTSRAFWRDQLGDTDEFALAGNALWLSKRSVNSPDAYVPANNWGGDGWSFWQYSGCGSVSGISGCVDLDRANGLDLTPFLFG